MSGTKEVVKQTDIWIACFGNQWIAGEKEKLYGNDFLSVPRAYVVFDGKHGFLKLPGNPESVDISNAYFSYKLIVGEVLDLYFNQIKKEGLNQDAVIVSEEPRIHLVT